MRRRGPAPGPLGTTPAGGALLSLLSLLLGVGVLAPPPQPPSPVRAGEAGAPAVAALAVPAFASAPAQPAAASTTVAPPRPAPPAVSRSRSAPAAVRPVAEGLALWLLLADCESGFRDRHGRVIRGSARWHLDSGNGYYGAFQFAPESWAWTGGRGLPHEASPREQLHRAVLLQRRIGWARAWPMCARMLGLAPPAA